MSCKRARTSSRVELRACRGPARATAARTPHPGVEPRRGDLKREGDVKRERDREKALTFNRLDVVEVEAEVVDEKVLVVRHLHAFVRSA